MSRSYRQTELRQADACEAARQRGLAMQAARQVVVPQPTVTPIVHLNPSLLGSKEERDAFADEMLRQERARERDRAVAEADEVFTEGRVHRRAPAPVNYAET